MDTLAAFAERLEQLFHEAMELQEGSRLAFIEAACGEDKALHDAVLDLLEAFVRAERNPAWNEPAIVHEARSEAAQAEDSTEPDESENAPMN